MNSPREVTMDLSINTLQRQYRAQETDPLSICRSLLGRIRQANPRLHAFITSSDARALQEAEASVVRYARRCPRGPLDGIPYAAKDNLATRGVLTTGNSRSLSAWIPDDDCPVIARLTAAGAILMGKLSMNEFGLGGFDLSPIAACPWNTSVCAGGSSGGSASAVAAGLCTFSLGTDGGGSVRIPAAICGLAGLAPTPERINGSGFLGAAHHPRTRGVGPLARRASDVAAVFETLAGRPVPPLPAVPPPCIGRLSVIERIIGLDLDVAAAMEEAAHILQDRMGASIRMIEMHGFELASEMNWRFLARQSAELYAAAIASHPSSEFTRDFLDLLERGRSLSKQEWQDAIEFRRSFVREVATAFQEIDFLWIPTMPMLMTPPGERPGWQSDLPKPSGIFTAPTNLAGLPAISLPVRWSRWGTPVGIQFAAPAGEDCRLIGFAVLCQQHGLGASVMERR